MFSEGKTIAQKASWISVWIFGAGTAAMMVACATLFYAAYSNSQVFLHDIVTEILVATMFTYLGLLITSVIASRLNSKEVR